MSYLQQILDVVDQAWLRIWNRTAAPASFQALDIPPDPPPGTVPLTRRAPAVADAQGKFPCLVPSCRRGPFNNRQALSDHHNRSHRPASRRYFCPYCDGSIYNYEDPYHLEKHCALLHQDTPPISCPIASCSYTARCPVSITCHCNKKHRGVALDLPTSQPLPPRRPRITEASYRLYSSL